MMKIPGTPDKRRTKGEESRIRILDAATNLASSEGLESITFRRLKERVGMSQSGLFRHFGSKSALQAAIIDHAWKRFKACVIEPAANWEKCLERLYALCVNYLSYLEEPVFEGGCFFCTVGMESRNGDQLIRSQLRSCMQGWLDYLTAAVNQSIREGSLPVDTDPYAFAFELHCLLMGANWKLQVFDDRSVLREVLMNVEKMLKIDQQIALKVRQYDRTKDDLQQQPIQ